MSKLSDAENRLNPLPMKRHNAGKPQPITIAQPPTMSEPKTMTPRQFYRTSSDAYFLISQQKDAFDFAAAYHAHELAAIRREVQGLKMMIRDSDGSGTKYIERDEVLRILDAHKP